MADEKAHGTSSVKINDVWVLQSTVVLSMDLASIRVLCFRVWHMGKRCAPLMTPWVSGLIGRAQQWLHYRVGFVERRNSTTWRIKNENRNINNTDGSLCASGAVMAMYVERKYCPGCRRSDGLKWHGGNGYKPLLRKVSDLIPFQHRMESWRFSP